MTAGVSRAPEQSQVASLAAASTMKLQPPAAASQDVQEAVSKPSYKTQLMWMHRLPAYRTRFQQISQAAFGSGHKVSDKCRAVAASITRPPCTWTDFFLLSYQLFAIMQFQRCKCHQYHQKGYNLHYFNFSKSFVRGSHAWSPDYPCIVCQ